MLVCLQLSVLGGKIESVRVTTCEGKEWSLNGSVEHIVERNLVEVSLETHSQTMVAFIRRMGGIYSGDSGGNLNFYAKVEI